MTTPTAPRCEDTLSLSERCPADGTVPMYLLHAPDPGPRYYCREHADGLRRRMPSAWADRDPDDEEIPEPPGRCNHCDAPLDPETEGCPNYPADPACEVGIVEVPSA